MVYCCARTHATHTCLRRVFPLHIHPVYRSSSSSVAYITYVGRGARREMPARGVGTYSSCSSNRPARKEKAPVASHACMYVRAASTTSAWYQVSGTPLVRVFASAQQQQQQSAPFFFVFRLYRCTRAPLRPYDITGGGESYQGPR